MFTRIVRNLNKNYVQENCVFPNQHEAHDLKTKPTMYQRKYQKYVYTCMIQGKGL